MDPLSYNPVKLRKNSVLHIRVVDTDLVRLDNVVKHVNKSRTYYNQVDRSKLVREMINKAADNINQLELPLKKNS